MIIPFEQEFRKKYYKLLDQVFDSSFWSEGKMIRMFEEKFGEYVGIEARTVTNGGAGLLSILEYINVKNKDVIVPANTFWATALAAKKAGANVIYADSNKEDLCLSYEDMVKRITPETKAVIVVHIGGHIAFDVEKIARYCKEHNIYLVEDCAHVHGGSFNGKKGGHWGFAGSYSFYATKTMPTGEGGMVVSRDKEFLSWLVKYRNYGKEVVGGKVAYPLKEGFNYRMSEFVAALGIVQLERLPVIVEWKHELANKYDKIFENRVKFPENMVSGYYKYIVYGYELNEETGKVFGVSDLCHRIDGVNVSLPNAVWIAEHHRCPPIFYGWEKNHMDIDTLRKILVKNIRI